MSDSLHSPTREKSSPLWFFSGFLAVLLAGVAKIVIADRFSPQSSDDDA